MGSCISQFYVVSDKLLRGISNPGSAPWSNSSQFSFVAQQNMNGTITLWITTCLISRLLHMALHYSLKRITTQLKHTCPGARLHSVNILRMFLCILVYILYPTYWYILCMLLKFNIILTVFLCEYKTWFYVLREEHKLLVCEYGAWENFST